MLTSSAIQKNKEAASSEAFTYFILVSLIVFSVSAASFYCSAIYMDFYLALERI